MPIEGTKDLGIWGKLIPVNDSCHITQTNQSSHDGYATHVTTEVPSLPVKVHDRFDANGNYLGSDFAKR